MANNVGGITNSISLDAGNRPEVDREEIKKLAQQFEAMLMTQMLREMRRSMLDEEDKEDSFGYGALTDTVDVEFGQALSRSGGVGLTDALLKAFERQISPTLDQQTPEGAGGKGELGAAEPGRADKAGGAGRAGRAGRATETNAPGVTLQDISGAAPVSSPFGWRPDPLTGVARFHNGVDIAVAYGRDIKAAASGTVSFAGNKSGYGQTVVIDHADGRQTRYAHLSEPTVKAGDAVAEGQIVGKSGNSGRSTGPHLHFEILVDGQPVDPGAELAGL